jgi:hypothetical protein
MLIDDFDILRAYFVPAKENPPLAIDPDAPLAGAVALQHFEPVAGGTRKSCSVRARCSIISLRNATVWMSDGSFRLWPPSQILAVSAW